MKPGLVTLMAATAIAMASADAQAMGDRPVERSASEIFKPTDLPPDYFKVSPAPAPPPPPAPPAPPPAPPAGALTINGRVIVGVGKESTLPVQIGVGSLVEISSRPGAGVSVKVNGGVADSGVPVVVDPAALAGVRVIGNRPGVWQVGFRALGPGGWSNIQEMFVNVKEEAAAEPPPPEPVFEDPWPAEAALRGRDYAAHVLSQGSRVAGSPERAQAGKLKDPGYAFLELPEEVSTLPVDRTKFLMAGTPIPLVTLPSINSQVPGTVLARVARDVYAAQGDKIILPKGTDVTCAYEGAVKQGQTRLPLACERAVLPNGTGMLLTDSAGADAMGRFGLVGTVDNRVWERYQDAVVTASLAALVGLSSTGDYRIDRLTRPGADALANTTATILNNTLQLNPVVGVAPGNRVLLVPAVDIVLREPGDPERPRRKKVKQAGGGRPASSGGGAAPAPNAIVNPENGSAPSAANLISR